MDLDEVRLKEPDELSKEEKTLLTEHKEELSDEEKDAFKSVIEPKKEEKKEEEKEEEPFKTFKTQDELDSFIEGQKPKEKPEGKEGVEPVKYFADDYKPKDWNQFANDLVPKLKPEMRKETEAYTQETKDEIAKINAGFDQEIEQLRAIDPDIPAPNTPERVEFDKGLAQVALKNKDVRTMTQAYSIYKQEKGGEEKKDEKDDKQEDLAKKVGGGKKSGDAKKERKYAEVAGGSEEDAWDAALRDLETGS